MHGTCVCTCACGVRGCARAAHEMSGEGEVGGFRLSGAERGLIGDVVMGRARCMGPGLMQGMTGGPVKVPQRARVVWRSVRDAAYDRGTRWLVVRACIRLQSSAVCSGMRTQKEGMTRPEVRASRVH